MDIQRVFGCGIDKQTFKMKYESLSNPQEKMRLDRVAKRLQLTLSLRYRVGFYRSLIGQGQEGYTFTNKELPSMEIYLLCTCLDTLAGQPKHLNFDDWIEAQENIEFKNKNDIIKLYKQYNNEYGVGKNLKDLFINLPPIIKTWLSNNVAINRTKQPQPTTQTDTNKLMVNLYKFFYNLWRNPFTHNSDLPQASIANDIFEPTKDDNWWSYPTAWLDFELDKKQGWELSYKKGLDLVTILRLIINVVALQILEIDVTQEYISSSLRNFSRLNGLYAFINEVDHNSETLKSLSQFEEYRLHNYLIYRGIPVLQSTASTTMIQRYDIKIPLEASLHRMTTQYLTDVNQLNSVISNFNGSNPIPESQEDNSPERLQKIKYFLAELAKMSSYLSILNGPPIGDMSSVWIVIQDPCYI